MKIFPIFLIFLLSIISFSCKSTENGSTTERRSTILPEDGKYDFYMYDSSGVLLLTGELNVSVHAENKLSGTYTFTNVFNSDFGGYHSMDGEFEGDFNPVERKIFINTNPRIADANVFLYLDYTKHSLSGTWKFSTFRGAADSRGTFKAYKRSS
jgi:hypothetical protein